MKCTFCESGDLKNRVITENNLALVFPTKTPVVQGHVLIIPKRCVPTINDLENKELKSIFDLLKRIKPALKKTYKAQGFNHAWNEGEVAGQSVPHVHLHVLPRKESDTGVHRYEPRKFLYWTDHGAGEDKETELLKIAKKIKKGIE